MSCYFLVLGLPYRRECAVELPSVQLECLQRAVGALGQEMHHFTIPPLKIGSLDSLMEASDELARLDPMMENTVQKLITFMQEASGKSRDVVTTFRVSQAQEMSPGSYIRNFVWSAAQFDPNSSLQLLIQKLSNINSSADDHVRGILTKYNDTRNKIASVTRKTQGNLSLRPIDEIIQGFCSREMGSLSVDARSKVLINTEILGTVVVAVPIASQKEWLQTYWTINEYVCPDSNMCLAEDKEFALNRVVMLRKVMDDFKSACRKKRFIVRDVEGNEDCSANNVEQLLQRAERERKSAYTMLWQQYCVCFVSWIHLKALRVFVESLLHYGLPPRIVAAVVLLPENKESELRERIAQIYPEFGASPDKEHVNETSALQQEYPYVSLKISNVLVQ